MAPPLSYLPKNDKNWPRQKYSTFSFIKYNFNYFITLNMALQED